VTVVALLSAAYPPKRCGVGAHTFFLAKGLTSLGHEVHVVTEASDRAPTPNAGVAVHPIPSWWTPGGFDSLAETLSSLRPDIVHVQLPNEAPHKVRLGLPTTIRRLRRKGYRVVLTLHEMTEGKPASYARGLLLAPAAHLTIFPNPYDLRAARRLLPWAWGRFHHVPLGPTLPLPELEAPPEADPNRLGFLGFLNAQKGMLDLLQALQQVKVAWPEVRLDILTSIDPADSYHRGVLERIAALGLEGHVEVRHKLEAADIQRAVQACTYTCLPFTDGATFRRSTVLEALAAGTALVTTTGPRVPPALVHGETAWLTEGNPGALAAALLALRADPVRTRRLRGGALAVAKRHRWAAIAAETHACYKRALHGRTEGKMKEKRA